MTEFLNEPEIRYHQIGSVMDETTIRTLSGRYKSSREVILRRLLIFGLITQQFYELKRGEYIREFLIDHKEASGFAPQPALAISANGKLFTNLVLKCYHEGKITASFLSDCLGVRVKHINDIEYSLTTE